jgi:DNA polymerase-3 subunit alpha
MGKKSKEVMAKEKDGFVSGAIERGIDAKVADQVFELMAFFAGYGFNRSHSAAYAWVSYQTAYLKTFYPHEFMAGLMSCDQDNTDNIVKFIGEARSMGLAVARPDINESAADFTVVPGPDGQKVIRFGLGAVKGVGQGAVEAVIEVRSKDGPFVSLYEFCRRVDSLKCNRRVIEALVKAGAFDGLATAGGLHRARLFATIEAAMERGAQDQRDRRSGQTSLFGLMEAPKGNSADGGPETYPDVEEWPAKELLAFEKEALGFYISGHPLDRYRADLKRYANASTIDFAESKRPAGPAAVGGVVAAYRERPTKKGDGKIAFFQLEDAAGQLEVVVFPKTFEKVRQVLVPEEPILCTGKVVDEGENGQHAWKMLLEDAVPLAELRKNQTTRVDIHIDADRVTPEQIAALEQILASSRGACQAVLHLQIPRRSETSVWLDERWKVAPSEELLARIERLFGAPVATLH